MIVIKYRSKPPVRQKQVEDFLGSTKVEEYDMNVPREYRVARRKFKAWLAIRPYTKRVASPAPLVSKSQQTLLKYLPKHPERPHLPRPKYLGRFRSIPQATYEEFAEGAGVPRREWDKLQAIPAFDGYFNQLLELNDFFAFDDAQEALEAAGTSFRGVFARDVVAFELLRRQLGFRDYAGIAKVARFVGGNPLAGMLEDPSFFPTAAKVNRVMILLPASSFVGFHRQLVRESITLGWPSPAS